MASNGWIAGRQLGLFARDRCVPVAYCLPVTDAHPLRIVWA